MTTKWISFIEKQSGRLLVALLLLTLIAGALYSAIIGDHFRFYDEGEYYLIAQNLVETGMYTIDKSHPTAWRPPGYPLFLSLFLYFGSSIVVLRFVNFLLLAATIVFVYRILEKKSRLAAFLGACLMLFYPLFFFTAGTLYPQTLTLALFIGTLYLIHQKEMLSYTLSGLIGAIYGFLTLIMAPFIGSLLVTIGWLFLSQREGWKKGLLMFITASMVVAPWTIRNYRVFDSFVFIATNGGVAFVLGNSPDTQPNLGGNILLPEVDKDKMNEVEIDRYLKMKAIDYMLNNPVATAKMYVLKFLNHFNYTNVLMTANQMSFTREGVLFITYYTLLGLAVAAILFSRMKLFSFNGYLIALYLLNGALFALFITRIRYRLPYDPILILLGAPFLASWLQKRTTTQRHDKNFE